MTDQRKARPTVSPSSKREASDGSAVSAPELNVLAVVSSMSQDAGKKAEVTLYGKLGRSPLNAEKGKGSSSLLRGLTQGWGSYEAVSLYLNRCQVDTPTGVVEAVWNHIAERRQRVAKVVDFGAGDGRFARSGQYDTYIGYEIDRDRSRESDLPPGAILIHQCAFADVIEDADVCIGNPPYVRNQDLPKGWRERAAVVIRERTGVAISGLANAWQYFALLALASTKNDGLVALVIPFEWVSRPSARALRDYIHLKGWAVSTHRLRDETFHGVLTTSSITLIDKRDLSGKWQYFEEHQDGKYRSLPSPSGTAAGVLTYAKRSSSRSDSPNFVRRGLSPGTQEILTLSEGERVRFGLQVDLDVVPCVTSLRSLTADCLMLTKKVFNLQFRDKGMKCWLIRTDRQPSSRLKAYLDGVPRAKRETKTCSQREEWWKFTMPQKPSLFVASGFRGPHPKIVLNDVHALAVGAVFGVYGLTKGRAMSFAKHLRSLDLTGCIVSHSNGLKKLEPRQLTSLVDLYFAAPRIAP